MFDRRTVVGGAVALAIAAGAGARASELGGAMYGLIGKMRAVPGKRSELVAILLEGTGAMPGNLAYFVAEDLSDEEAIWITEVWQSKEAHAASLELPSVRSAIARGRPLIAGFEAQHEVRPIGGAGLSA